MLFVSRFSNTPMSQQKTMITRIILTWHLLFTGCRSGNNERRAERWKEIPEIRVQGILINLMMCFSYHSDIS